MTSAPSRAKIAAMFAIVEALVGVLLSAFKPRASLVAENLALRQQLAALRREVRLCWLPRSSTPGRRVPTAAGLGSQRSRRMLTTAFCRQTNP